MITLFGLTEGKFLLLVYYVPSHFPDSPLCCLAKHKNLSVVLLSKAQTLPNDVLLQLSSSSSLSSLLV